MFVESVEKGEEGSSIVVLRQERKTISTIHYSSTQTFVVGGGKNNSPF